MLKMDMIMLLKDTKMLLGNTIQNQVTLTMVLQFNQNQFQFMSTIMGRMITVPLTFIPRNIFHSLMKLVRMKMILFMMTMISLQVGKMGVSSMDQ